MQDQHSNSVYVVALRTASTDFCAEAPSLLVERDRTYFHPVGNTYPKEPPNYIAFRYDGELKSIHHIDSWEITTDMHAAVPSAADKLWEPHFLYRLGPAIHPDHQVRTGKGIYRAARVTVALDLLFTSTTISEARDATRKRESNLL